jgi:MerR family mercuric resistance operon transcriptional regulator
MAVPALQIREVAEAAGVNVETLRYYERRGILRAPRRSRAGYRQFPPETVQVVRFIKRAQALGFTLEEIVELLALRRPRAGRCAEVHLAAHAKVSQIDEKIRHLVAIRTALATLADACAANATDLRCPLIEALAQEDSP